MTVQDVFAFFSQHDCADRIHESQGAANLLLKANGRPSGQAVVQMRSQQDAMLAQQALSNKYIGDRYIEVFAYGGDEEAGIDGEPRDSPGGGAPPPFEGPVAAPGGIVGGLVMSAPPPVVSGDDPWSGLLSFLPATTTAPAPMESPEKNPIWV
jgi:hypothetical protein